MPTKLTTEFIDPRHLLIRVAGILERLGILYAVTGGMAVFVWARPRFTDDIDIVVQLEITNMEKLAEALATLSESSYISKETMRRALERKGEFNFIDGASGIKVDFWTLGDDPFEKSQLSRRVSRKILEERVFFVSPEDLILSKLSWFKESESSRQLEDVESILAIQKKLDWPYLWKWSKKQGTVRVLRELKTKAK